MCNYRHLQKFAALSNADARSPCLPNLYHTRYTLANHVISHGIDALQVENAFSQPNGGVCLHMLTWAQEVTRNSGDDLLELYCGNGNFTIALAANFKQVMRQTGPSV